MMQSNDQTRPEVPPMGEFSPDVLDRLEADDLEWHRVTGSPKFDYPIDYSVAFLRADTETGQIEFLSKFAPNSYCHYHTHIGRTLTWVLKGEQHIIEETETQTIHKTRRPGFKGLSAAGNTHWEYGGSEGAVTVMICEAINGKMFDLLSKDGTVLATAKFEDFASGGKIVLQRTESE